MLAAKYSVSGVATLVLDSIGSDGNYPRAALIRNVTAATTTAYIGGATVDATNGFPLDATTPSVEVVLDPGEVVYCITGGGAVVINVLRSGF